MTVTARSAGDTVVCHLLPTGTSGWLFFSRGSLANQKWNLEGQGKPEPARRKLKVKIHPPVQLTGIGGGDRDKREKGWAVFVPI